MVLRMALRMGEQLGPERVRVGVRIAGPPPQRMTAARNRVIALLSDGLLHGKSGAAREAGVVLSLDTNFRERLWPAARARSVIDPMRLLGRAMRRFGDGDLRSRATPAGDEVGTQRRRWLQRLRHCAQAV